MSASRQVPTFGPRHLPDIQVAALQRQVSTQAGRLGLVHVDPKAADPGERRKLSAPVRVVQKMLDRA